jgi:hypothetical protein
MKKNILLPLLAAFICIMMFNSCSKVANAVAQALTWQGVDVSFTVSPISDTVNQQSIGTGTFTYNLDSFIKAKTSNLLGLKNVDTLRFSTCTLTITNNADANNNFQNFEMASASFSTSANTTSTSLGQITNNPNTYATILSIPVNSTTNLKSYIPNSGSLTVNYTCSGKLRTKTTNTLTINAHVDYYIHVTP